MDKLADYVNTTVRLGADLDKKAKEAARTDDRTVSSIIRQALRLYLKQRKSRLKRAKGA